VAGDVVSLSVILECREKSTLYLKPDSVLGDKVVLYVHHTFDNKITKSVKTQLDEFDRLGWKIVLVDSSDVNLEKSPKKGIPPYLPCKYPLSKTLSPLGLKLLKG
jgi:hypothetical protein